MWFFSYDRENSHAFSSSSCITVGFVLQPGFSGLREVTSIQFLLPLIIEGIDLLLMFFPYMIEEIDLHLVCFSHESWNRIAFRSPFSHDWGNSQAFCSSSSMSGEITSFLYSFRIELTCAFGFYFLSWLREPTCFNIFPHINEGIDLYLVVFIVNQGTDLPFVFFFLMIERIHVHLILLLAWLREMTSIQFSLFFNDWGNWLAFSI